MNLNQTNLASSLFCQINSHSFVMNSYYKLKFVGFATHKMLNFTFFIDII